MKVFLDSIGCRLNQSEIERMARHFRQAGHRLVATPEECDLVVLNTCSVTAAGASDSRSRARQAHRRNPQAQIVLTGCWSSLEEEKASDLPGVSLVVPNWRKDRLVPDLLGLPSTSFDRELLDRRPVPGNRMRTRAFVKAQDGCNNRCAYCVATIARGPARSVPQDRILDEIRSAVAGGAQEAVLTGVQLSAYGQDLGNETGLTTLVRETLTKTGIPRLRLSSLEPWRLTDDFFALWQDPRLCRHLHLPLQSGCGETLHRMARPIGPAEYSRLVSKARAAIPDLALTTDIIVGFPGESEDEFAEGLAFIQRMAFAGVHVFVFSPRPGTPAFSLPGRVPLEKARDRSRIVRETVARTAHAYRSRFIGKTLTALWESASMLDSHDWKLTGLSDNYLRVCSLGPKQSRNQLCPVRIMDMQEDTLIGEIASPSKS